MAVVDDVIIGVDPHKLSATIEVVNRRGLLVGAGRFPTDKSGYKEMRRYVAVWPTRLWAVEGSGGAGRPLAQRLLEAGELVVDVPAKLAARARLFDTGHNRKTDALDAHSIAMVAVRTPNLRRLTADSSLEALRMLADRRDELAHLRIQVVNRLQRLLSELVPARPNGTCRRSKRRRSWQASGRATSPGRPGAGWPPNSWPTWSRWTRN